MKVRQGVRVRARLACDGPDSAPQPAFAVWRAGRRLDRPARRRRRDRVLPPVHAAVAQSASFRPAPRVLALCKLCNPGRVRGTPYSLKKGLNRPAQGRSGGASRGADNGWLAASPSRGRTRSACRRLTAARAWGRWNGPSSLKRDHLPGGTAERSECRPGVSVLDRAYPCRTRAVTRPTRRPSAVRRGTNIPAACHVRFRVPRFALNPEPGGGSTHA